MPKNIALFCDGTGNRGDAMENGKPAATNVYKAYRAATDYPSSGWTQTTWYDEGVGTGTSIQGQLARLFRTIANMLPYQAPTTVARIYEQGRLALELATGTGITENITQGYRQIVHHYRPGDRIYLFGFSRGAYTARCIAGVISRCGLLRAENIRYADEVVDAYAFGIVRSDPDYLSPQQIDPVRFYPRGSVRIAFLGVWDTVASLGLPLWGWWFRKWRVARTSYFDTTASSICDRVRHAISMDERRSQFFVTLFDRDPARTASNQQDVQQIWFRGSHAGVGGGYADTGLSDIPLHWMLEEARAAGLLLDPVPLPPIAPANWLGQVHNQLQRQRAWYLFGTWPRWHPCPRPDGGESGSSPGDHFGALASSVYQRAALASQQRQERSAAAGPDGEPVPLDPEEMLFLDPGESALVRARADRQWNRTGLVIEGGGLYRLRPAIRKGHGSFWRDKDKDPCGAEGQEAGSSDLRRFLSWTRRYREPGTRWMELIGTVTHPRKWELREEGVGRLLRYVFWKDPEQLTRALLPLGRHLALGGAADGSADGVVYLRNEAASGMLYLFANDAWLFYANNTGAIDLLVERVDPADRAVLAPEIAAKRVCLIVQADGGAKQAVLS